MVVNAPHIILAQNYINTKFNVYKTSKSSISLGSAERVSRSLGSIADTEGSGDKL